MAKGSYLTRAKRWTKFLINYMNEKLHGLDFSMAYAGELQQNTEEFHGYSMTDAGDMRRMLQAVPVDPASAAFLDVGCGKGMCMRCAAESGYKKVAGLDLDQHLLEIARRNMEKLKLDVSCIYANAADFTGYAEYDVFYFFNPFGRSVLKEVIQKLKDSQNQRNRDIRVVYYRPLFSDLFDGAGFELENEIHDKTRDTITRFYYYPKQKG